jgi:hypothetical protein
LHGSSKVLTFLGVRFGGCIFKGAVKGGKGASDTPAEIIISWSIMLSSTFPVAKCKPQMLHYKLLQVMLRVSHSMLSETQLAAAATQSLLDPDVQATRKIRNILNCYS